MLPGNKKVARLTSATAVNDENRTVQLTEGVVLTVTNYTIGRDRTIFALCQHDGQDLLVPVKDLARLEEAIGIQR